MFGIKMPWTKRREAREAEESRQQAEFDDLHRRIALKRAKARATWTNQPPPMVAPSMYASAPPQTDLTWAALANPIHNPYGHYEQPAPVPLTGRGGAFDGGGATGDWRGSDAGDSGSSHSLSSSGSSSDGGGSSDGGSCGGSD